MTTIAQAFVAVVIALFANNLIYLTCLFLLSRWFTIYPAQSGEIIPCPKMVFPFSSTDAMKVAKRLWGPAFDKRTHRGPWLIQWLGRATFIVGMLGFALAVGLFLAGAFPHPVKSAA